jgi:hypothetical protein
MEIEIPIISYRIHYIYVHYYRQQHETSITLSYLRANCLLALLILLTGLGNLSAGTDSDSATARAVTTGSSRCS